MKVSSLSRKIIDIPEEYRPKIEELPGQLPELAEAVEEEFPGMGVAVTLAVAQRFGGTAFYVHGVDKILLQMRDDAIRAEFDDKENKLSGRQLCLKWGISMSTLKRILSKTGQNQLADKQMRMW